MKNSLFFVLILFALSFNGYAQKVVKLSNKGSIKQASFIKKIPFRYEKKHIFVDVMIKGKIYNFLFDTGADFNIIDLNIANDVDYKKLMKAKSSGSSFKKQKTLLVEVDQLNIGNLNFNGLVAAVMNLSFISDDYPCSAKPVAGVIGANLLRKVSFQIDYKNQQIIFTDAVSNFDLSATHYQFDILPRNWGSPLVNVIINGFEKQFTLDCGSGGKITTGISFKETLSATGDVKFITVTKNKFTNYYALVEQVQIADLSLSNDVISLENGVSSLIGNELLEKFLLTFNWDKNKIHLEKVIELEPTIMSDFEITLKPNYITNKIEISEVYNQESSENEFEIGMEVFSINGIDVSNLSEESLCNFWKNRWTQIKSQVNLTIAIEGKTIELTKKPLTFN